MNAMNYHRNDALLVATSMNNELTIITREDTLCRIPSKDECDVILGLVKGEKHIPPKEFDGFYYFSSVFKNRFLSLYKAKPPVTFPGLEEYTIRLGKVHQDIEINRLRREMETAIAIAPELKIVVANIEYNRTFPDVRDARYMSYLYSNNGSVNCGIHRVRYVLNSSKYFFNMDNNIAWITHTDIPTWSSNHDNN